MVTSEPWFSAVHCTVVGFSGDAISVAAVVESNGNPLQVTTTDWDSPTGISPSVGLNVKMSLVGALKVHSEATEKQWDSFDLKKFQ